jgi:2-octaprenyl-6-methoxyphenol hydroxylase
MDMRNDILVAGAGAIGLSVGVALARVGWPVTVVGAIDRRLTGRTVALLEASLAFYQSIGLRDAIAARGAPLLTMRIVDDTGSLFRLPQSDFDAGEIGLDAFGLNIENRLLLDVLVEAARETPGLRLIEDTLSGFAFRADGASARLSGGPVLSGALLVAADGARSSARRAAAIETRVTRYPQTALTMLLAHELPHHGVSTEFHTRQGPFTLVPLPADGRDEHRSSLVWMTAPLHADRLAALSASDLSRAVERQAHSMLGPMEVRGSCGKFPVVTLAAASMTASRLALAGDAAHSVPPIGAQGLNLGLRDAGHLVEALEGADDPGAAEPLDRYARLRKADVALRTIAVDALNRSLLTPLLPMDFLRGAGLLAVSRLGPLRRFIMREGVAPSGRTPRMMRPGYAPARS